MRSYAREVPRSLPLFPLGTVLFPGLVLPLHIFEERYRALVRDLVAAPDGQRELGVIAIRKGREVGVDGVTALYDVGCTARLQQVQPYDDGRFDIVTVGTTRFRLGVLDTTGEYVRAEVELLAETDADAAALVPGVTEAYRGYLAALAETAGGSIEVPELPDDPLLLASLVAATVRVDLGDRQALLEAADAGARLAAELRLLRRESTLLRALPSTPAPEFGRTRISPN